MIDFDNLEDRKKKEIEWADYRRTIVDPDEKETFTVNQEFYQINKPVNDFVEAWLRENLRDKEVFEMACGLKPLSGHARDLLKSALCSDIASETIRLANEMKAADPSYDRMNFEVIDAENTGLPDNSFDVIVEGGALHHMDLDAAYAEAARLLRPGGKFFCVEAIKHNPIIHNYRKRTPHLRTAWEAEHILGRSEINKGLEYFDKLETQNFHIATLPAIAVRNNAKLRDPIVAIGSAVDKVLTRVPGLKWLSWQCVFVLENPKKA